MNGDRRRRLARAALDGYASGPDAPIEAEAEAVHRAQSAQSVVLVEGISDQIALEALAVRQGRDLTAEGIVIVPIGGAQAIGRSLARFGPKGVGLQVTGLCDRAEAPFFRRALAVEGVGPAEDRADMEASGFFVCVEDLEEELIRAVDREEIERLLDSQGDLNSLRTLQRQPAWRARPFDAQMHRWLRAGARRNLRYARLLVEAMEPDRVPVPLVGVLSATGGGGRPMGRGRI